MQHKTKSWARGIARATTRRPWTMLAAILILSAVGIALSETLALRLNFTDLLPENNPVAERYRAVMDDWAEPAIVIVLEGDRPAMERMAAELGDTLPALEGVYNVQARLPREFFIDHGFALLERSDFDRMTEVFDDPALVNVLHAFNDDYEREYTDSEDNLRDDELQVARSLHGVWRSLEVLEANLAGREDAPPVGEAALSIAGGEPWMMSLRREQLMVMVYPEANSMRETEELLATTTAVQRAVDEIGRAHPGVRARMTGMGPIGKAEMESIGPYTYLYMLIAFVLIYLLLARSAHGWVLPFFQLAPLLVGIFWTMGFMALAFGQLNYFTVMMGLVLMGLGIDFTIHLVSRYGYERGHGADLESALERMLGGTGTGVLTGGLTTAAAFFALLIADTRGVYEFGFAAGAGVVLTLVAVMLTLPTLLVLRERVLTRQGRDVRFSSGQREGWDRLGGIAEGVWRRPAVVLGVFALLAAASVWAARHIDFEYDFMKLEPQGAPSVILQDELPERFGISDQAGWVIHGSVDSARADKRKLEDLPSVGSVEAISDYIPDPERLRDYRPALDRLRASYRRTPPRTAPRVSSERLLTEVNRLWDNLDLMSNLAFQAGLDRVVTVIDGMTGYRAGQEGYDSTAVLPRLTSTLERDLPAERLASVGGAFESAMHAAVLRMTNGDPVRVDELPAEVRRAILPREGAADRYRTSVSPRGYVWTREAVDRFVGQTSEVAPGIVSTPHLFIVMTEETLRDGRNGSLLALAVIVILLFVHFRGPRGLVAIVPLLGGAVFMIGAMYLIGMKYNYMNLIALPVILGIGIDDGVHALHRWREEGADGASRVRSAFGHVGRAILLTSLTTMIGFGSIGLYKHPGMASFGIVLFMGVGLCFLGSVLVLPAVVRVVHGRGKEE